MIEDASANFRSTIFRLEETEDTSRNKRWLIPIIVVLSIVSALALAALGIVIYTLITLNKNLATTTTTTGNSFSNLFFVCYQLSSRIIFH